MREEFFIERRGKRIESYAGLPEESHERRLRGMEMEVSQVAERVKQRPVAWATGEKDRAALPATRYGEDPPFYDRDEAAGSDAFILSDAFECATRGAAWCLLEPGEPQFDAFSYLVPEAKGGVSCGRRSLRLDTTLSPADRLMEESYVRELPVCCLQSFKVAVAVEQERRRLSFECECGVSWRVTSSHDDQVLERFVVHGGPRVGGGGIPPTA